MTISQTNTHSATIDPYVKFLMDMHGITPNEKEPNFHEDACLSDFEDRTARELNDPEKAEVLARVYDQHLQSLKNAWPLLASEGFTRWLSDEALYLGCPVMSHMDFFYRSFPEEHLQVLEMMSTRSEVEEALNDFFVDFVNEWKEVNPLPPPEENAQKTAVIFYRLCGKGHLNLAKSVCDYLQNKGCLVHLVDGGKFEKLPLEKIAGHATSEKRRNCEIQHLRGRVRELHPDFLFNCVAHHGTWKQPGYDLGIPTAIIHSDYEVDPVYYTTALHPRIPAKEDELGLVKYCIPSLNLGNVSLQKLRATTSVARSSDLIRGTGFPLRPAFKRESDLSTIQSIRERLGLREGERMIVMMAHREDELIEAQKILAEIMQAKEGFPYPVCIVAVCGANESSKEELEFEVTKRPEKPNVRLVTKSLLSEQEMSDYMKAISRMGSYPGVMITPTGGCTTAEAAEMGVYVIRMPIRLEGELSNARYLAKHGLCDDLSDSPIVNKVSQALQWQGKPEDVYHPSIHWEEQLGDLYDELCDMRHKYA